MTKTRKRSNKGLKPWLKILIGLTLGIFIGLVLFYQREKDACFIKTCTEALTLVGNLFIDLLKMLVGLIVFSSIVVGMCHISDPKKMGRIGLSALMFYVLTTLSAIVIGLAVVLAVRPGAHLNLIPSCGEIEKSGKNPFDFLFSIVPSNPVASFAQGNILQIIFFGIFFAIAIHLAGDKGKIVLKYMESLSEVMACFTQLVMKFAPYGAFALMAAAVGVIGSKFFHLFLAIGCIFLGALIHIILIFCFTLKWMAKVEIAPFFKGMKDAIVVAFTTSSSAATLPVSLECARNHLGLPLEGIGLLAGIDRLRDMIATVVNILGDAVVAVCIGKRENEIDLTKYHKVTWLE